MAPAQQPPTNSFFSKAIKALRAHRWVHVVTSFFISKVFKPLKPHPLVHVVTLVLIAVLGNALDTPLFKTQAPWLVELQFIAHRAFSIVAPAPEQSYRIRVVEVDDDAFWSPPLNGTLPTNRSYLGELIRKAADAGARVIGLDFDLRSPYAQPGDVPDRARKRDNDRLFDSILYATNRNIPVVLSTAFVRDNDGVWERVANIFDDRNRLGWPVFPAPASGAGDGSLSLAERVDADSGVGIGFINLPADARELPLQLTVRDFTGETQDVNSFAVQVANAYLERESPPGPSPARAREAQERRNKIIHDVLGEELVYGFFLSPSYFLPGDRPVTAGDLMSGGGSNLSNEIVLIGNTAHSTNSRLGPYLDRHQTPMGMIPGVYVIASQVESLLDGRYLSPLSKVYQAVLGVLAGLVLIKSWHWSKSVPRRFLWALVVSLVFFLVVTLVVMVGWNRYMDSAIAILLVWAHIGVEHYVDLSEYAEAGKGGTKVAS